LGLYDEINTTIKRISARNVHERRALRAPRDELWNLADTVDGLLESLLTLAESEGGLDHRAACGDCVDTGSLPSVLVTAASLDRA
jgi:hypothetical protein